MGLQANPSRTGLFQVLREVWHATGALSLYRGLDAHLSKGLLSSALMLAIKERTEKQWQQILYRGPSYWEVEQAQRNQQWYEAASRDSEQWWQAAGGEWQSAESA